MCARVPFPCKLEVSEKTVSTRIPMASCHVVRANDMRPLKTKPMHTICTPSFSLPLPPPSVHAGNLSRKTVSCHVLLLTPIFLTDFHYSKVTTAVLAWDWRGDGGGSRPLSSTTVGADSQTIENSRPSSAAFRRWVEARPSARSAVSAVSSARTLGMDDPELAHLQLELESRMGSMSETTLARVCRVWCMVCGGVVCGDIHERWKVKE